MTAQDADILTAMMKGDFSGATDQWLRNMKEQYPFFPVPEAMNLRDNMGDMPEEERKRAISHIALSLGGGGVEAAGMICPDGQASVHYPQEKKTYKPSTENTIDKFLSTYGNTEDAELSTLEKLIFNPVADYSQQLMREAEALPAQPSPTGDSQEDRINRFILSVNDTPLSGQTEETVPIEMPNPEAKPAAHKPKSKKTVSKPLAKVPEQPADNSLLSESLAKIYIKTKRYERAYEILNRLSLAFPEKNAYFADQLRFLRKLMLAESYSKKRIENQTTQE